MFYNNFGNCENAAPTEANIKALTTAITTCIGNRGSTRGKGDLDLIMQFTPEVNKEMDPVVVMLKHRVLALRRALVKSPRLEEPIKQILRVLNSWGHGGTEEFAAVLAAHTIEVIAGQRYRCWVCNGDFKSEYFVHRHLRNRGWGRLV